MSIDNQIQTTEQAIMDSASAEHQAKVNVLMQKYSTFEIVNTDEELERANECAAQIKQVIKALDRERLDTTKGLRDSLARINKKWNDKIQQLQDALDVPQNGAREYMLAQRRKAEAEAQRLREEEAKREEHARLEREATERQLREAEEKAQSARMAKSREKAAEEAERLRVEREKFEQDKADEEAAAEARAKQVADQAKRAKSTRGSLGSSASLVDRWTFEVVDMNLLPEAFKMPPQANEKALQAMATSLKDKANVPGVVFKNNPTLAHRAAKKVSS